MLPTRKFIVTIVAAKVTVNAQCEQNQKKHIYDLFLFNSMAYSGCDKCSLSCALG